MDWLIHQLHMALLLVCAAVAVPIVLAAMAVKKNPANAVKAAWWLRSFFKK